MSRKQRAAVRQAGRDYNQAVLALHVLRMIADQVRAGATLEEALALTRQEWEHRLEVALEKAMATQAQPPSA